MIARKLESSVNRVQYCFRPALAEARLMTAKQASDRTHFLVLAEDLGSIEQSVTPLEHNRPICCQQSCLEQDTHPAVWQWMRETAAELDRRVRHIGPSPSSPQASHP